MTSRTDKKGQRAISALAAVFVLVLLAASCGSDSSDETPPQTTTTTVVEETPTEPEADEVDEIAEAPAETEPASDGDMAAEDPQPMVDDGSGDEEMPPQTELGREAMNLLGSFQEILAIQQQYSDSCPTEEVVAEVNRLFAFANAAGEALSANMVASENQVAIAEAAEYLQEGNAVVEQLVVLGPEIIQRCNLGHLVADSPPTADEMGSEPEMAPESDDTSAEPQEDEADSGSETDEEQADG